MWLKCSVYCKLHIFMTVTEGMLLYVHWFSVLTSIYPLAVQAIRLSSASSRLWIECSVMQECSIPLEPDCHNIYPVWFPSISKSWYHIAQLKIDICMYMYLGWLNSGCHAICFDFIQVIPSFGFNSSCIPSILSLTLSVLLLTQLASKDTVMVLGVGDLVSLNWNQWDTCVPDRGSIPYGESFTFLLFCTGSRICMNIHLE